MTAERTKSRGVRRQTFEAGLQIWRPVLLDDKRPIEAALDRRQLLITPEGKALIHEHPGLLKQLGRELLAAASLSNAERGERLGWEYVQQGQVNNLYRRTADNVDLAIRMRRPDPQFDTSEVPSNAVQAQLLRLLHQEYGHDVVAQYFATPDYGIMEYVEAPLVHDYAQSHPQLAKELYDRLWQIEKDYRALSERYRVPLESDIKSLRRDTSNAFAIERADGTVQIKLFDIGLLKGASTTFPFLDDKHIIRTK